jgi:ADP-ribosylglycohydrolase
MLGCAAGWAVRTGTRDQDPAKLLGILMREVTEPELTALIRHITESLAKEHSVEEFADSLGLREGVSGYMYHTVPIVLYAFLRHMGDYETTVKTVIALGGDTDSTAAAAGALAGAATGYESIPTKLVDGICEWPRSVSWMKRLARRLALSAEDKRPASPISLFWPVMILRNFLFLVVVLIHGLRRLFPPY